MVAIQLKWYYCICLTLLVSNLVNLVNVTFILASGDLGDRENNRDNDRRQTFIVHMNNLAMPTPFSDHVQWYSSLIQSTQTFSLQQQDDTHQSVILYTYRSAFHGLAARLTSKEAERLATQHGVMSVVVDTMHELKTTRSPAFLGLETRDERLKSGDAIELDAMEQDVVVGVLDTGIWPESESFNDTGMLAPPVHWKGSCEVGHGFEERHCGKKIVGARSFYLGYEAANGEIDEEVEYKSPRDQDGHGTHTAATVAGSPVHGANLFGHGYGTSRGMAPGARIAVYKVCWSGGCFSSDILSAVDQAVDDGVNILSISLGSKASSYHQDSLSIATFGAMELGIFVSCAAGNEGPDRSSITNVSPWMMTAGASTIDREFPGKVKLGSGEVLAGVSVYKGRRNLSPERNYSLVYIGGGNSTNSDPTSPDPGSLCLEGMLDEQLVAGKIVICDRGVNPRVQKGQVVKDAGGVGMILSNIAENGGDLAADSHLLPAVAVSEKVGDVIKRYLSKDRNPTANLAFFPTKIGVRPSPLVAAFSSRGPNVISPEILKPDVVAPGVNILAAWTLDSGPSGLETDKRKVKFNILSGTSMSCPHVSGVAAWLMARRPNWSPAAIKSALMTTAYIHDNTLNPVIDSSTGAPSGPYDHGAGHINPPRALDPGLVYDITPQDYFDFLCAQGLTRTDLMVFGKFSNLTCTHSFSNPSDLNYPALSIVFPKDDRVVSVIVKRTVTNVGPANSRYRAKVSCFKGVDVKVNPTTLKFVTEYEKLSYKVTFTTKSRQVSQEFGGLIWNDGEHKVRSPVVVTWL